MDQSASIRSAIIVVIAISLALWLGVSIVTDQTQTVLYTLAGALFLTCIFLGRKIWLLLILFTAMNVPLIRGFGTTELGQALFVGFTFVIFLMRRQPTNFKFGEMELWMLLLAACIVQVYLRNPVGLNMFGAGAVGAKPYFMVAMAFAAGSILGNVVINPADLKWYMRLTIIGSFLGVGLTAVRMRFGVGPAEFVQGKSINDGLDSGRSASLGAIGSTMARILASFISPLRACLHPLWAPFLLISIAAAAGSGYRNSVASVGIIYIIGIAYRGGFIAVFLATLSAAMGFGLLAVVNVASPLPPNVQRALSPFPGTWEKRYVDQAESSTEWRVEMWKEALFTDYWIHNKLLGDGLGLTRQEMLLIQTAADGGPGLGSASSGMTAQQESMMVVGGYHSGPVQTVRTVGYVGLMILVTAMIRLAVRAHRQIKRCRGTEWFTLAIFTGIPVISLPFIFIFIFGDFGRDVAAYFMFYGMIRLLEKNLPLPAYHQATRTPYSLAPRIREKRQAHGIPGY